MDIKTDLIFLDIEASGLHKGSFPIEFGWTTIDMDVQSCIVRPLPEWTLEYWSFEAEKIHGITWDDLQINGEDAHKIATRIAEEFNGKTLVSDAPQYDGAWLLKLLRDAGVTLEKFAIVDLSEALATFAQLSDPKMETLGELHRRMTLAERFYPHPHRAGADALRMAAACRALFDVEFREYLEHKVSLNIS